MKTPEQKRYENVLELTDYLASWAGHSDLVERAATARAAGRPESEARAVALSAIAADHDLHAIDSEELWSRTETSDVLFADDFDIEAARREVTYLTVGNAQTLAQRNEAAAVATVQELLAHVRSEGWVATWEFEDPDDTAGFYPPGGVIRIPHLFDGGGGTPTDATISVAFDDPDSAEVFASPEEFYRTERPRVAGWNLWINGEYAEVESWYSAGAAARRISHVLRGDLQVGAISEARFDDVAFNSLASADKLATLIAADGFSEIIGPASMSEATLRVDNGSRLDINLIQDDLVDEAGETVGTRVEGVSWTITGADGRPVAGEESMILDSPESVARAISVMKERAETGWPTLANQSGLAWTVGDELSRTELWDHVTKRISGEELRTLSQLMDNHGASEAFLKELWQKWATVDQDAQIHHTQDGATEIWANDLADHPLVVFAPPGDDVSSPVHLGDNDGSRSELGDGDLWRVVAPAMTVEEVKATTTMLEKDGRTPMEISSVWDNWAQAHPEASTRIAAGHRLFFEDDQAVAMFKPGEFQIHPGDRDESTAMFDPSDGVRTLDTGDDVYQRGLGSGTLIDGWQIAEQWAASSATLTVEPTDPGGDAHIWGLSPIADGVISKPDGSSLEVSVDWQRSAVDEIDNLPAEWRATEWKVVEVSPDGQRSSTSGVIDGWQSVTAMEKTVKDWAEAPVAAQEGSGTRVAGTGRELASGLAADAGLTDSAGTLSPEVRASWGSSDLAQAPESAQAVCTEDTAHSSSQGMAR